MQNDISTLTQTELEALIRDASHRLSGMKQEPASKQIVYSLNLDAGNTKAGAKTWAKHITGIDASLSKTAHGFQGDWLEETGALPAGSLVLIGGRGGSWKNSTSSYVLVQVVEGATFEHKDGYQSFSGSNLKLIESDGHYKAEVAQKLISRFPELAPAAAGVLLPLYNEYLKLTRTSAPSAQTQKPETQVLDI